MRLSGMGVRYSRASRRVLLVHISTSELPSFVQRDVELLGQEFTVTPFFFGGRHHIAKLFSQVARHDLILCWFAWDNAYWATWAGRLLQRPSIVIAGGFDVVALPEVGYGNLLNKGAARRT